MKLFLLRVHEIISLCVHNSYQIKSFHVEWSCMFGRNDTLKRKS